jgi:nicotinamidase-related amidase
MSRPSATDIKSAALATALQMELQEDGVETAVACGAAIDLWARCIAESGVARGFTDQQITKAARDYEAVFHDLLKLRLDEARAAAARAVN